MLIAFLVYILHQRTPSSECKPFSAEQCPGKDIRPPSATMDVHPSQRRTSCEGCRKHNWRCQRIRVDDPKCARCMMLDIHCHTGEPKRAGRPKKSTSSSTPKITKSKPRVRMPRPQHEASCHASPAHAFASDMRNFVSGHATFPDFEPADSAQPSLADFQPRSEPICPSSGLHHVGEERSEQPPLARRSSPEPSCGESLALCNLRISSFEVQLETDLAELQFDLQARESLIMSAQTLDFDSLFYQDSPLYLAHSTLGKFTLTASERLVHILDRIRHSPPNARSFCYQPYVDAASADQDALTLRPLALTLAADITGLFGRLLLMYKLVVDTVLNRLQRPELGFPAVLPDIFAQEGERVSSCMQGVAYCNYLLNLLHRIEQRLGVCADDEASERSMFSIEQVEILESIIDGDIRYRQSKGILQLGRVKKLLRFIACTLSTL